MAQTPLVRGLARLFGILWIIANLVNLWKVVSAAMTTEDPYERAGYIGAGLVLVPLIFYCTFQIVALSTKIVLCLKILLVISLLAVLARGIIPLELVAWMLFELLPSKMLINSFSRNKLPHPVAFRDQSI
jgi:hypothetical protein